MVANPKRPARKRAPSKKAAPARPSAGSRAEQALGIGEHGWQVNGGLDTKYEVEPAPVLPTVRFGPVGPGGSFVAEEAVRPNVCSVAAELDLRLRYLTDQVSELGDRLAPVLGDPAAPAVSVPPRSPGSVLVSDLTDRAECVAGLSRLVGFLLHELEL